MTTSVIAGHHDGGFQFSPSPLSLSLPLPYPSATLFEYTGDLHTLCFVCRVRALRNSAGNNGARFSLLNVVINELRRLPRRERRYEFRVLPPAASGREQCEPRDTQYQSDVRVSFTRAILPPAPPPPTPNLQFLRSGRKSARLTICFDVLQFARKSRLSGGARKRPSVKPCEILINLPDNLRRARVRMKSPL